MSGDEDYEAPSTPTAGDSTVVDEDTATSTRKSYMRPKTRTIVRWTGWCLMSIVPIKFFGHCALPIVVIYYLSVLLAVCSLVVVALRTLTISAYCSFISNIC
jgi:hypothetical protein